MTEQKYSEDERIVELEKHSDVMDRLDDSQWSFISGKCELTDEFMRKYVNFLDFKALAYGQTLTEKFVNDFEDRIEEWCDLFINNPQWSEKFIISKHKVLKLFGFSMLDYTREYSPYFINYFRKYLRWDMLTFEQSKDWSLEFIKKYQKFIPFNLLIVKRKDLVNQEFLKMYHSKIAIENIKINDSTKFLIDMFPEKVDIVSYVKHLFPKEQEPRKDVIGDLIKRVEKIESRYQ